MFIYSMARCEYIIYDYVFFGKKKGLHSNLNFKTTRGHHMVFILHLHSVVMIAKLNGSMRASAYMQMHHMCLVPVQTRRKHHIP